MLRKIIPTIFAYNKEEFDLRFKKLVKISKELHIDIMDGKFVKAKGIKVEEGPECWEYLGRFEAHLMVKNPEKYIDELKKRCYDKVIFHVESKKSNKEIEKIINMIKEKKMKAWIALNPNTSLKKILPLLETIDGIMFMGIYPGKEKQKFNLNILKKIKELRKINNQIMIQVDGGVNLNTIGKLREAGVNIINTGSFVSEAQNPKKALKMLEKEFTSARK